jgi:DNA (cytosine-5)-methyltransferase 1
MNKTFADFFAGIGLAELGLRAAGWRCKFANDIAQAKKDMWKAHFRSGRYLVSDIHSLKAAQIPDVTLWWASFPCTDVSLAGYRAGLAGDQSGSVLGLLRLLREKDGRRPPLVVLENVSGFISSHAGADFEELIRQLNGIGYTCDAFFLDAIHFVPQSRPRLFIVGVYDQPKTRGIELSLALRSPMLKSTQLTTFIAGHTDLDWTMLDIPAPPHGSTRLGRVLEELDPGSSRWWSEDRVEYLLAQMSNRHRLVVEHLRSRDQIAHLTAYRRMRGGRSMAEVRADGIAGCLRTPRGGSSRQILIEAGNNRVRSRYMTPREYARLMGADRFRIEASDNRAYFGFGDAVCVPAVKWIARNVLQPLVEGEEIVHAEAFA